MRCRPGDMAVIVDAFNKSNLGKIVTVIGLHDGTGDLLLKLKEPIWLVSCCVPLIWSTDKKRWRRKSGPAGDSALQPIRGIPVYDSESTSRSDHRELADLIV
jgi:hypothetical protein